jgi:hypothetical protein
MTVFRPSARVTSPDGREWEIYAYKIKVRDREYESPLGDPPTAYGSFTTEWALIDLVLDVLLFIPRGLLRLGDVVLGAARSVRSDEWTIDAVAYLPHPTVYTWTTTREYKGQVLAQVEGHLARGDIPAHLTNAIYRGEDRRSAR